MPLRRWRGRAADDADRREAAIERLLRSLARLTDVGSLQSTIAGRLAEFAGAEAAIFFEHDAPRDRYRASARHPAPSAPGTAEIAFDARGPLARWLRVNEEPLVPALDHAVVACLSADERALLRDIPARLCLPLVSVGQLLGVVVVCGAADPSSALERPFLAAAARQAAFAYDTGRLHHAEQDRLRSAHQANQLSVAGRLAATMAHEVRNPLTAIRSSVQYVLDSPVGWPEKRELLQEVLTEVDRIDRTIVGVLGLSRPRTLDVTELDLVAAVEHALALVGPYAESRGVGIARRLDCRPLPIRGDARELGQVLMNVLLNACEAMPEGGELVVRSAAPAEAGGAPQAVIAVSDNGPGMPPDVLGRVFDPFFTTKHTGTGLGLPISLEIMSRHGGRIRVDSHVGAGTTVVLELPFAHGHDSGC